MARIRLSVHVEEWASKIPFRITGRAQEAFEVVVVELVRGTHRGRGEGVPIHYLGESARSLARQIDAVAAPIEAGIDRQSLLQLMPPGAARNALDAALWDLEAKSSGKTIWQLTGIEPKPLVTVFTIGLEDAPEAMAERAIEAAIYPILKVKLNADRPIERIEAIRRARPDARLVVDANQGWTFAQLTEVAPVLARFGIQLIEQPLPRGQDDALEGLLSPVPLSADESCQHRGELEQACRRYQIINVKLDKCGGLTEALAMARIVEEAGLDLLVSNMGGTSLAMAPAFVLAQRCRYVELDGPLLLKYDRIPGLPSRNGQVAVPDSALWG